MKVARAWLGVDVRGPEVVITAWRCGGCLLLAVAAGIAVPLLISLGEMPWILSEAVVGSSMLVLAALSLSGLWPATFPRADARALLWVLLASPVVLAVARVATLAGGWPAVVGCYVAVMAGTLGLRLRLVVRASEVRASRTVFGVAVHTEVMAPDCVLAHDDDWDEDGVATLWIIPDARRDARFVLGMVGHGTIARLRTELTAALAALRGAQGTAPYR